MRIAQFGDGYQQRAAAGLNALAQEWDYLANDVDDEVAADMVTFLRANAGLPFDYVPLWATTALKFTCDEWTRTQGSAVGKSSIHATFTQWFGP